MFFDKPTPISSLCQIVLKYVSPHIKLPDGWQGGSENVTGYFIDVVHILQKSLGFDFEFVPGTDGFWGSKNEDGTWNGVVGMVVREEADLIGCPLSITLERSEVRITKQCRYGSFSSYALYRICDGILSNMKYMARRRM